MCVCVCNLNLFLSVQNWLLFTILLHTLFLFNSFNNFILFHVILMLFIVPLMNVTLL